MCNLLKTAFYEFIWHPHDIQFETFQEHQTHVIENVSSAHPMHQLSLEFIVTKLQGQKKNFYKLVFCALVTAKRNLGKIYRDNILQLQMELLPFQEANGPTHLQ